ncbi:MAG TPA: RNA polymerase sigma factor [Aggregicoccus sp.]|nr:RNA polymerase sigma factor [Aggregicoccus sp.]
MTEDRLSTLYRTYGPTIYARCRHILGDEAAAADATQETFLRVHRKLDAPISAQEVLGYIYRVATNHCFNVLRDRRRQAEPMAELPEGPGPNLEEALGQVDLARRLMAQLPQKLAAVAWLHHVDGLTQEELARVLGVSRRTVVNRLSDFQKSARKFAQRSP